MERIHIKKSERPRFCCHGVRMKSGYQLSQEITALNQMLAYFGKLKGLKMVFGTSSVSMLPSTRQLQCQSTVGGLIHRCCFSSLWNLFCFATFFSPHIVYCVNLVYFWMRQAYFFGWVVPSSLCLDLIVGASFGCLELKL